MDHCKNLPLLLNNLLRNFHSINEKLLLTPTKASISPAQTNPVSSAFHRICDPVPSHLDSPALNSLWLIKAIYWGSKTACGILNRAFQMGIVTFCVQPSSNTRACCWLMLGWLAATAPRSVPAELLLSQSVLSWHNFKGLFLYRCRTLRFSEVKMFKHTSPGTETCSAPLGPRMTFTALPLSAELVFYHRGE